MRFMLGSHERPSQGRRDAYARPLGFNYVDHVSTQRRYYEYDCCRSYEQTTMEMLWPYRSSLVALSNCSWMIQMSARSRAR